jgi:hypothetical protein
MKHFDNRFTGDKAQANSARGLADPMDALPPRRSYAEDVLRHQDSKKTVPAGTMLITERWKIS